MSLAKSGSLESVVYSNWIKRQPCAVCASSGVEGHHVTHRSSGVTRDDTLIPLCAAHHQCAHNISVVVDGERHQSISLETQLEMVAYFRSLFFERASREEWRQFTLDRERWLDLRGADVVPM